MDYCDKTRFSRTTLIVAVSFSVLMLGLPSFAETGISPVGKAAALPDVDRLYKIGTLDLSVSTLNVFEYTMVDEAMCIWSCMSTLLTYNLDLEIVGDLAKSWDVSDDGLTWDFEIVDNAYFCDPDDPETREESRKLTVHDVIFTYNVIQDYKSNLHYFPGPVDGPDVPPTIASMTPDGDYRLTIQLDHPYAPFVGALASIPILPRYYWEPGGGGDPTNFPQALPIGSGPFYYALDGTPDAGEATLKRNPIWFQEENRGWQIHVDTLKLVKVTNQNTAWEMLKNGDIDCLPAVSPSQYVKDLPGEPNLEGFAQSTGFVYEISLNQLTLEMREQLGWTGGNAYNSQILLDPVFKKAFARCIDKDQFVEDVLEGLGSYADSLVPEVNPWYHRYDGPELVSFDPDLARLELEAAGWKYDAAGRDVSGTDQCPLYDDEGVPLEFRFYTLNTAVEWEVAGTLIVDWCEEAGIKLNMELLSVNQMNNAWYIGDYDIWLWDWIFSPLSDPSTDILSVLTTMEIGTWSGEYMSVPEYDALYNESLRAMDPIARHAIVDEMQNVAYENFCCQCPAYRKELYGINTDVWRDYGNWESNFMLMPDQSYPYVYMMMSPRGPDAANPPNPAPTITGVDPVFEGLVNDPISFTGTANDESTLAYKWFWGDDSSTDWMTSPSTTHTYTEDGYYDVYFAAKEVSEEDTADFFISWTNTTVKVIDNSNTAPHSLQIEISPSNPDIGDVVTFNGSAIDDNGDDLRFSWSFGDLYSAKGQNVTHQYTEAGSYTVTMYVDDEHLGEQARPVSTNRLLVVSDNAPPTIDVPDFPDVIRDVSYDFSVVASDGDSDPLTLTWIWGDGTETVTSTDTASHAYANHGQYTLTVYADDGAGSDGHNVSDTGLVTVTSPDNIAPEITSLLPSKTDPYTGEEISFTGIASDSNGDALRFTFDFGDDTYAVFENPATAPDTAVEFTVSHTYESAGTLSAYLYVWDYQDNSSSSPASITVIANAAPLVSELVDMEVIVGSEVTFTVTAFDPDGDDVTIWWDFGDGSDMVEGATVTHTYDAVDEYVYRVYLDDGHYHNVTAAAIVYVLEEGTNLPPEVVALENRTGLVHASLTFNVTATDPNDDDLNCTWDFGDGSDLAVGETVQHAYSEVDVYTFTVYVNDSRGGSVSKSATINIVSSDAPVADAGYDQTVEVGDEVSFDGSGSSDDVRILNFTWTFALDDGEKELYGAGPEFIFDIAGEYIVTLTVKDAENKTGTDEVLITVQESDAGSWIDQYGLALGAIAVVIVAAMAALTLMKRKKGGKAPADAEVDGPSTNESESSPETNNEPGLPPEN
ncbi:MAG: PKD domain-containing protein [Methanobacteriota archaeon]|nr:MAG: PKD domain-containing protein [Euryarchaeota archaeon]